MGAAVKIHEYQAKEIFRKFGVPTPRGEVVDTAGQAREAAQRLGGACVVKAQIHAGGRGKAGGIRVIQKEEDLDFFSHIFCILSFSTFRKTWRA